MNSMQRTELLGELVAIDAKMVEATSRATNTTNDFTFEKIIQEVRRLRRERAEVKAKLDALPN